MQNVYDVARELVHSLKECDQYKNYKAAKAKIDANADLAKMINDFTEKGMTAAQVSELIKEIIASEDPADLDSAARSHGFPCRRNTDRPHDFGILDAPLFGHRRHGVQDLLIVPLRQVLKNRQDFLQNGERTLAVGFGLFVDKQISLILRQLIEEIQLFRNIRQHFEPCFQF